MDREQEPPHIDVRPIDLDRDRRDVLEFGETGSRPPLPPAVKWLVVIVVVVAALLFVTHRSGTPTTIVGPAPTPVGSAAFVQPAPTAASPLTLASDKPIVSQVGYRLFGEGGTWELFGRSTYQVVRIQPSLGRFTVTRVPPLASGAPSALLVGSKSAIVVSFDNVVGYSVPDGRSAQTLARALHAYGEPIPGPDPDHVWTPDFAGTHLHLVDLSGRRTGPTLTLPSDADINGLTSDGSGYVLVETQRGAFDVRPGSTTRVTTGQVLAVGATGWLVSECNTKVQTCSAIMVDRVSHHRRRILPYTSLAPAAPGVISPDGRHAAVIAVSGDVGTVNLIDLPSGKIHPLDISINGDTTDAMVWSPDSKWVFVADGAVKAVNAATAAISTTDDPWGAVTQVAIRPN